MSERSERIISTAREALMRFTARQQDSNKHLERVNP